MGILQSQVGLVTLWAAAGLATLGLSGLCPRSSRPSGSTTPKCAMTRARSNPAANIPTTTVVFAELKALGFVPIGKTRERFRFFTPLHWLWLSNGCRWFASPDRRVHVEITGSPVATRSG